jgi:hypothetical protein
VRQSKTLFAALAAVAVVGLASTAEASTVFNTSLPSPGVIYGSGNPNDHFTLTNAGGVTLGLKSKIYQQDVTTPVGDVYSIGLGNVVSVDYAVIPGSVSLAGTTASLNLLNERTGQTASFDPSTLDNATSGGAYENSERLTFGFLSSLGFDRNKDDTYLATLSIDGLSGGPISVENVIKMGTGAIPEPATWALMMLGLGGIGAALRRNRRSALAAIA